MGFLTRLLAGLTAAAALGAGLAGTANAVDTNGGAGTTKSVVKLAADDTNNLPDHLVNGDFSVNYKDQWLTGGWNWTSITPDGKYLNSVRNWNDSATTWKTVNGWDKTKFGWSSTQKDGTDNIQHKAGAVEVQYDDLADNVYAELCAYEAGTAIYQDIKTVPGTLYKVRLKHASLYDGYLDKMQVMIGAPGHEQPVEMTRTGVNGNGDKLNEKSNIIATKVSNTGENDRNHDSQWETYEGTYLIPEGQTTTRFTFRSVDSKSMEHGNLLDDIVFDKAYKLSYDKNASDASGQVPSNQRGKENTTQPAKTKTNGKIRLASDTSKLSDHLINSDFEYLPDGGWKTISARYDMASAYTSVDPNNGQYIRNTRHAESDTGTAWVDWDGFDASKFAWRTDQKGGQNQGGLKDRANAVELQQDSTDGNTYAEMVASETGRTIYQDLATIPGTLYKIRLKHASLCKDNVDQMQVVINGTPIEMTRVTANGKAGDKVGEKSTTIATKVTNENRWHHADQWETYEGYYVIPDGQTTTRFGFKAVNYLDPTKGNLLDDVTFARAYKLSYDKNSTDATGEVPSNQRGRENTTQPAKTKTSGTVKTVADTNASLPDHLVNGDFSVNYHDQWKDSFDGWTSIDPNTGKTLHATNTAQGSTWKWTSINGWNRSQFGWTSTQKAGSSVQQKANAVELQYDDAADNVYAELCAYEAGTAIYQDIKTVPGTLYKVRLRHASLNSTYLDKMQVMIGTPGHEQPVEMTRTSVNGHGDKLNEKSTVIATKVTNGNNRHHESQWETYEGTYLIPDGQTATRFTFKSIDAKQLDRGNVLDDIVFDKAYRLDYDKNATDANGSVPSDETAGTIKQTKAKTTGTVKTVADENVRYGSLANGEFSYPSFSDIQKNEQETLADLRTFLKSDDGTLWYNMSATDFSKYGKIGRIPGFDSSRFAWSSTENGSRVELQQDRNTKNTYAEIVAQQDNTSIYQNVSTGNGGVLYKIRLKHASRQSSHADRMQVLVGSDMDHATPVEMTRVTSNGHGDKVGGKSTIITTKVSNTDPRDHGAQWETYEGYYQVPEGQKNTVFMFKSLEGFKEDETLPGNNVGNLVDDIEFSRSYKLTYDANSSDASGQVPSDTAANTVKQAKSKTNGSVKLVADDDVAEYAANGLPKQIMNGDFDHDWRNIVGQSRMSAKYNFANVDPARGDVEISGPLNGKGEASKQWVHLNGFDANKFGWKSNQTDTRVDGRGGIVEIQRSRANDNMYAEITASQANTYLYQDIDTAHSVPTVYTVKLRYAHRSGTINSNEKIQILVGAPGHEQPVTMTRIASSKGNRIGEKSTTVNAPNTDGWLGSWDTFQGSVVVPAGQNVSRFTFKSLGSIDGISGNLIDDVQFKLAYELSYNTNANDASGSVPSDETANTVKQAKARTTGTVRAVADRTASGLTVHDLKNGEIAPVQYGDFKFSTIDGVTAEQITDVNGFTVKTNWNPTVENQAYGGRSLDTMYQPNKNGASLVLHHVGQWRDSSGTQRWLNAKITVNGQNLGSLVYYESQHKFLASYGKWDRHTSSRPYMDVTVDFLLDDGSTPQGLRGVTGFTDLDGGTSGYNEGVELVSGFDGAYVRSDAHLARFGTNGWAGTTDENKNDADEHGMKHYVGATFTGSSFRVRWSAAPGQGRQSGFQPVDSAIAYRLTYDKNAQDATGSIPSDTAANTTRPAKSETDGKVSDLVQRTTTHEDGSVTVRTIDTSTDVVSGCQVYYPAGQRITLATMAKDDDCWDASMLSRPGHTQLGWNQDRNATQAQAQVTMVEGGMTVYAVWVGNPVLTYDTNKPSTWSGQMPSTPASVSVAYAAAAADGSGWRAGDVSKIRGYRFLGWYTAPQDNAGLYDWNTPLTGSVTVYAHWQRLQANVIYNANGGTGSHANTTGWQYSDVTIPGDTSKSFKHDGLYRFKHWNTQPNDQGTVYTDGSRIALQDKDITLYAIWVPYHENFVPTGGIGLPIAIAGGVLLLMFGIGSTVMLTRRMNGHGMPDDE
ncbi:InlB B-repeat-containing protein [Bifidobacterium adolescentis]|uniref:InlB B-repeat-containing protein n=1 Tax=Bifidobacterium adolescentis TaxID=1680 RepID=UPI0015F92C91|nr:InlB B-repeat-containing protein [Bifidobacterium adolescentis]